MEARRHTLVPTCKYAQGLQKHLKICQRVTLSSNASRTSHCGTADLHIDRSMLGITSNQHQDCYVDCCPSSAIKFSLLYQHVGLFTQHDALRVPLYKLTKDFFPTALIVNAYRSHDFE